MLPGAQSECPALKGDSREPIIAGCMNKRFLRSVGLLLGFGGLAVFLVHWYAEPTTRIDFTQRDLFEASKKMSMVNPPPASAPVAIPISHSLRLAIGSIGLPDDVRNAEIVDILTAELSRAKGLELVDRQSLDKVLREQQMSLSGLVRAKDAIRIGKLLRADWFLLGTPMHTEGSNSVVVRIVDARTGIFRDTTVSSVDNGSTRLGQELASFVRKCRAEAASAKAPIYLALGAFEDLSLNNRLANFPAELRAHLTAAYRGSSVTLLERDHVDTLLQEMSLDLAGLTENNGMNNGAVMQTAFWLLEGDYQSIDTSRTEMELALRVRRIFGMHSSTKIREPLGQPLFRTVKSSLDSIINQKQKFVIPTRMSEARAQMARAKELAPFDDFFGEPYSELTEQEAGRQRRNVEEAIRALKTVLLLDSTNREAKVYLSVCYCKPVIGRVDEGRQLFKEVLEEPVYDHWHQVAARILKTTFRWSSSEETFQWFSNAEKQTSNSHIRTFYHDNAEHAQKGMLLRGSDRAVKQALAEEQLLDDIRSCEAVFRGKSGTSGGAYGMYTYSYWFREDKVQAGKNLAAFLPRMTSEFPALAPHLTASALEFQRETNNPVVAEFRRQLEWCTANPGKVFALSQFWSAARYAAYSWCTDYGQYALAVDIMEGVKRASQFTNSVPFEKEDKIALAYAYKATKQWQQALEIFESFTNLPIVMSSGSGPWGPGFCTVLTAKEVAYCKEKLGTLTSSDPREFDMVTNCFAMRTASTFAADREGLWLGIGDQLMHLDIDLHTNLMEVLPKDSSTGINCLLVGRSSIWIGTDGEGLFEFDKLSHRTIRYTEKEGLMTDIVCTLCLAGDTLWIGYGFKNGPGGYDVARRAEGGLGLLELSKHRFRAFTPSLDSGTEAIKRQHGSEPWDIPTRRTVSAIAPGIEKDIWFAARGSPARRYRQSHNVWEGFPDIECSTLISNSKHLFVGRYGNRDSLKTGPLGVSILNFATHEWSQLKNFGIFPSGIVSALALEGDYLWVAGAGYIAKIDPLKNELLKFTSTQATTVDRLEIGGGFVWVQFNWHLYRAKLPSN